MEVIFEIYPTNSGYNILTKHSEYKSLSKYNVPALRLYAEMRELANKLNNQEPCIGCSFTIA